jgi:hypothetical protein
VAKPFDLKAASALVTKATQPGPWRLHEDPSGAFDGGGEPKLNYRITDRDGMWVADFGHDPDNSAFTVGVRSMFPAALREIKRLRAELAKKKPRARR